MNLFHRKSRLEKLVDTLESSEALKSAARHAVETAVSSATSPHQAEKVNEAIAAFDPAKTNHKGGVGRIMKTGAIVTVGLAAITAASASVSSLRHHQNGSA